MGEFVPFLAVLVLVVAIVAAGYAVGLLVGVARQPLEAGPFLGGGTPREHALSRFHVRWYAVTLIFLAFDMEMLFMYPWAVVVAEMGAGAVVEMFAFLAVLFVGVVYAWREGALRWA